jgi:hypothetical protein
VADLGADQEAGEAQLDWTKLERSIRPVYKTIPPASFMYGTLSLEIPQKKKKQRVVREKLAAKVVPEDVGEKIDMFSARVIVNAYCRSWTRTKTVKVKHRSACSTSARCCRRRAELIFGNL